MGGHQRRLRREQRLRLGRGGQLRGRRRRPGRHHAGHVRARRVPDGAHDAQRLRPEVQPAGALQLGAGGRVLGRPRHDRRRRRVAHPRVHDAVGHPPVLREAPADRRRAPAVDGGAGPGRGPRPRSRRGRPPARR